MSGKQNIQVGGKNYALNFSMQIIQVQGDDPGRLAESDPIGNVISFISGRLANAEGNALAGRT
jgi:hypothetical protein